MPEDPHSVSAEALWITGPGRCEMRSADMPAVAEGQAVVRSQFGAVSRGTERLILEGRVPASEHERMRGPHQEGLFPFPVKYGYAVVGEVLAGPPHIAGRRVFCLHPHQNRFVVAADALVPLPDAIPSERAVLAANMETALNIVWDAGILPGDRVAIVGGGLVGLLVASVLARMPAVETTLVDPDPARAAPAGAIGVAFSAPERAPVDCDVVIHASGHAAGLGTAIGAAGREARIVEASWYGEGEVAVPLGGAFHSQRLSIVASQVGAVPPARRARWSFRRRMEKALELLADDRLDILFTGETPFAELPASYAAILNAPGTLCHRIRYGA